jgi:hypothetical protein
MVGAAFTITVFVAVFEQPLALVPVTVYVTVVVGDALTVAPVVAESPVFGAHVYVTPPVAVNEVELPEHIVTPAPAEIVGNAFTDTILVAVLEQPLASVPVMV